ncbi:MAG: endonuclease V [Hymenobacteraceae bacterium]|nr:endonuclease V [Hymenobacteraceae bacterium]
MYRPLGPSPDPALVRALTAEQDTLRARVRYEPLPADIRLVAGCDSSFPTPETILSVIVLLTWPALTVQTVAWHYGPVPLPYIPGFLAFREAPNLLAAYAHLPPAEHPDVLVADGHGSAHPRRLGIAAQMGVALDLPAFGVGKSRLTGVYDEPGPEPGNATPLLARRGGHEIIGEVLRTRAGVLPVFISPGHRCDQASATALARAGLRGRKLPEPTRLADAWAAKLRGAPGPVGGGGLLRP